MWQCPRTIWTLFWMIGQCEELWHNRDFEYHAASQPNTKNHLHHELSWKGILFIMPSRQRLRYLRLEAIWLPLWSHYVHSAHPPHRRDIRLSLAIIIQIQIQLCVLSKLPFTHTHLCIRTVAELHAVRHKLVRCSLFCLTGCDVPKFFAPVQLFGVSSTSVQWYHWFAACQVNWQRFPCRAGI